MNRKQKNVLDKVDSQNKVWHAELQVIYGDVKTPEPAKRVLTITASTCRLALAKLKKYAKNHNFAWYFVDGIRVFNGDVGVVHVE